MSEYRSTLYCQERDRHNGGTYLTYFMAHPEVTRLHDNKSPVFEAVVERIEPEPDCYWGWWDNKDGRFHHVYPAKLLVEMCFPYGTKPEIERGNGLLIPVRVIKGREIPREPRT